MLPAAAAIATIAMASGIEGATFLMPVFVPALRLPPEPADSPAVYSPMPRSGSSIIDSV